MHIRAARIRDLAAVATCEKLAFAPFAPVDDFPAAALPRELAAQIAQGSIYVIGDGGCVFGYVSMWPTAGHLFIETLAVLPARHGHGLGCALLAFAEREAARRLLSSVRLFTKETMAANLGFYRRRGYRETGRCDDDGFARVFYLKDVALGDAGAVGRVRAV